MFTGMLFGIILAIKVFPEIPLTRAMHRAFVEVPVEKLGRMDRQHLIYGFVALCMLFSSAELILVLGSSDLLMLIAWDISLYVDAVIASWTVVAVTRLKGYRAYLKARIGSLFRRAPKPRAPRRRVIETEVAANDSEEDGAVALYALAA